MNKNEWRWCTCSVMIGYITMVAGLGIGQDRLAYIGCGFFAIGILAIVKTMADKVIEGV